MPKPSLIFICLLLRLRISGFVCLAVSTMKWVAFSQFIVHISLYYIILNPRVDLVVVWTELGIGQSTWSTLVPPPLKNQGFCLEIYYWKPVRAGNCWRRNIGQTQLTIFVVWRVRMVIMQWLIALKLSVVRFALRIWRKFCEKWFGLVHLSPVPSGWYYFRWWTITASMFSLQKYVASLDCLGVPTSCDNPKAKSPIHHTLHVWA